MTVREEYDAVRTAIQLLVAGAPVASVSAAGMTVTYHASRLEWLQNRETYLLRILTRNQVRKRVFPDFSG